MNKSDRQLAHTAFFSVNGSLGEFKEDGSSGVSDMRCVLLENAREALNKYLLTEREKRKHKLGQNDIECEVIDSCLLKIYMSQGDNDSIYQLLQHPNDCNIDECSKILYESKVDIYLPFPPFSAHSK